VDFRGVLIYYERQAGPHLADRFQHQFEQLIIRIRDNPMSFHPVSRVLRRANFRGFPYHLLFQIMDPETVHVLVLRHHRRRPDYGTERE
jgi:plasmid stabilization system protein ParE